MNNKIMPLIEFSLNTAPIATNNEFSLGMDPDGSFSLSHELRDIPPEDTQFTLKHIFVDASGSNTSSARRKEPVVWLGIELPQLTDEIITRDDVSKTVVSNRDFGDKLLHVNNRGVLRFPITMYPVDGLHNTNNDGTPAANDHSCNVIRRQNIAQNASQHYEHRGTHTCNIPLGRIRLDDHEIMLRVTPYAADGEITPETTSNDDQKVRIRYMQVILEYN
jgi:hypothetical protein